MSAPQSEFLRTAVERGYVHQCTDMAGLDAALAAGPLTAYIGFDATADSLHVGSLIQIMILRRLQRAGHRPLVLMGGGTTKVGDPSGKDEGRKLLSDAEIEANKASIRKCFANFLTFGDGPSDAVMADNAEWLDSLAYIPLLRDFGRHFSVNRMLSMDSVKLRLERDQPLTFLEFNYMVLQAYDFVELHRRYGCRLQMGGSDQWGNIVMGAEMGRRVANAELFGLTTPLIATASGAKMGKTAAGAVWLNPDRLAPYDYYQFWRNAEDGDVERFLKLFTDLPLDEIARLAALQGAEINDAKKTLAYEATRLCHGAVAADSAAATARRTFEQGGLGGDLPTVTVTQAELAADGLLAVDAFVRAGLASSKGEARRLIAQGGARIDDKAFTDPEMRLTENDLVRDGTIKLSAGKKRHAIVRVR